MRRAIAIVVALSALGSLSAAQAEDRIVVEATGFRSDRGHLRCFLFDAPDAYPTHPERAVATSRGVISRGAARCSFDGVAPGTYAIALHHDEDDDGQMDTGIFGIPTEGTGASRDARGSMGPPSFRDAHVSYPGGEQVQRIRIGYVF